jgi:hypothetical protein
VRFVCRLVSSGVRCRLVSSGVRCRLVSSGVRCSLKGSGIHLAEGGASREEVRVQLNFSPPPPSFHAYGYLHRQLLLGFKSIA